MYLFEPALENPYIPMNGATNEPNAAATDFRELDVSEFAILKNQVFLSRTSIENAVDNKIPFKSTASDMVINQSF